jgi:hypothetical protein
LKGGGGAEGGDAWEGRNFGEAEPVAAVRGIDAVFGAGAGEDFGRFMEDAVFVVVALDAEFLAEGLDLLFDGASVGIVVAVEIEGFSFGFEDELAEFLGGVAGAEDQSGAECVEVFCEGVEAASEEVLAFGTGPLVVGFPGAENVNGDDLGGVFGGVMEGGVVGEAEVFTEPVEGDAVGHGEGIRLGEG